jgi:hypothetical protein
MAKVKIKLTKMNKVLRTVARFNEILFQVATRLELLVLNNWRASKGADDKKFKKLSKGYKAFKQKELGKSIRDLSFSGQMIQGLDPKRKAKFRYVLGFQNSLALKRAQYNLPYAENMMIPVSDRIDKKLQRLAFDLYKKKTRT